MSELEARVERLEQHLRGLGLHVLTPEQAAEKAEEDARLAAEADKADEATVEASIEAEDTTEAAADLAREHGVDLSDVQGTGVDGRVTKADVQAYIDEFRTAAQ